MDTFKISEKDNVCVNLETGHKIADRDIVKGEDVVKYGFPIGVATSDIKKGEQVHTNNMKTKLEGVLKYDYTPDFSELLPAEPLQISAFVNPICALTVLRLLFAVMTPILMTYSGRLLNFERSCSKSFM